MHVDELVIRIGLAAEGVREGVDEALAHLSRLEEMRQGLSEEIYMRISEASVAEAVRKVQLLRDAGSISREEAHAGFAYILEAFEASEMQKLEIERRMYGLRRQMAAAEVREVLGQATGRDATTDFMAIIEALREVQSRYLGDLEIVESIEEEIVANMVRRNRKLADERVAAMEEQIEAVQRRVEVSRMMDGLETESGRHEHSLELERAALLEKKAIVREALEYFKEAGRERTDYEKLVIERLLEQMRGYYIALEDMEISMARVRQGELAAEAEGIRAEALAALRAYLEERQAITMQGLDAELRAFRAVRDEKRRELRQSFADEIHDVRSHRQEIQREFDEKIRAVRAAADAEIAEHRRRVLEIDNAIRDARIAEQDERDERRIGVIQDSLTFERDDFNRMQLERELERLLDAKSQRHERQALEEERRTLNEKIREAREAASAQQDILRQARAEAILIYNEETRVRVRELEKQRDAALRVMDEETRAGVENFARRRRDLVEFYRQKYDMAVRNSQDEIFLTKRTQEEMYRFLVSPGVLGNYRQAGQSHARAYSDVFHSYLDGIAARIAALAKHAASVYVPSPTVGQGIAPRAAVVNQAFYVAEPIVAYHDVKQAARAGIRLALG